MRDGHQLSTDVGLASKYVRTQVPSCRLPEALSSSGKDSGFSVRVRGFKSLQGRHGCRVTRPTAQEEPRASLSSTGSTRPAFCLGSSVCPRRLPARTSGFQPGRAGSAPAGGTEKGVRVVVRSYQSRRGHDGRVALFGGDTVSTFGMRSNGAGPACRVAGQTRGNQQKPTTTSSTSRVAHRRSRRPRWPPKNGSGTGRQLGYPGLAVCNGTGDVGSRFVMPAENDYRGIDPRALPPRRQSESLCRASL